MFNLLGHVAHRLCVVNYNTSENARRSEFFCPLKCLDIDNSHWSKILLNFNALILLKN